jgi:hypothetical protein
MSIQNAARTHRKIKDTSQALPRLDETRISSALGAEPSKLSFSRGGGPLSMIQVRQELGRRLQSSGGRPALADTNLRTKIPLSESQWRELEEIAIEVASPGFSPSAGQVASVLISLSLHSVRKRKAGKSKSATASNKKRS